MNRKAPKAVTNPMEDLTNPEDVEIPSWNVAELTEDLPDLPDPEDAELGELCRVEEDHSDKVALTDQLDPEEL